MGAANTLLSTSRHTLVISTARAPEVLVVSTFPFAGLLPRPSPRAGTPKREVAAPCAASWAKKAVSSMTLLIQNDLRWLLRRRGCGKVHAPRQRRTKQLHILIKIRSPCFSAACTRTRAHERLRVQIFTGKQPEIGGFGEKYTNCS